MKIIASLILSLSLLSFVSAQKVTLADLLGQWKIVAVEEEGMYINIENPNATFALFAEMVRVEKGKLTAADTLRIQNEVQEIVGEIEGATFLFKADKTYKATVFLVDTGQESQGTFTFNETTQLLSLFPLGTKDPESISVSFKNGLLSFDLEDSYAFFRKQP